MALVSHQFVTLLRSFKIQWQVHLICFKRVLHSPRLVWEWKIHFRQTNVSQHRPLICFTIFVITVITSATNVAWLWPAFGFVGPCDIPFHGSRSTVQVSHLVSAWSFSSSNTCILLSICCRLTCRPCLGCSLQLAEDWGCSWLASIMAMVLCFSTDSSCQWLCRWVSPCNTGIQFSWSSWLNWLHPFQNYCTIT